MRIETACAVLFNALFEVQCNHALFYACSDYATIDVAERIAENMKASSTSHISRGVKKAECGVKKTGCPISSQGPKFVSPACHNSVNLRYSPRGSMTTRGQQGLNNSCRTCSFAAMLIYLDLFISLGSQM